MTDIYDYKELIAKKAEQKRLRDEQYKESSKSRLKAIAVKKIQTTMIGALSKIENTFGFLFGYGKEYQELSPEEQHMRELFTELRREILDLGNKQMLNIEEELNQYDISWNRYKMILPYKPEGPKDGQ